MNRKFFFGLGLVSMSAFAGVKVTSLDLTTQGTTGTISVSTSGRSNELPDLRVHGQTIELTLPQSESFSAISKNVRGAILSANVLNGKAIVKAILPYDVSPEGVNLGWKNNNIEVVFPRGGAPKTAASAQVKTNANTLPEVPSFETPKNVKPVATTQTTAKITTTEATAAPITTANATKPVESKLVKEALNEDYLNKLMKEETTRPEPKGETKAENKKDEISVRQAAAALPTKTDSFSFAGYAVKFGVFLAMVLGLFYGVVQLLKKGVFNRGKLGFLNNSKLIEVLSTTYVAPKRSLMIVKAHKQIFLVANSESGLQFLSEMTDTSGLIKEGEKFVTGTNFDSNLDLLSKKSEEEFLIKLKENIQESTPVPEEKGLGKLAVAQAAQDIVKFSDELKKKARKLKPIEFN